MTAYSTIQNGSWVSKKSVFLWKTLYTRKSRDTVNGVDMHCTKFKPFTKIIFSARCGYILKSQVAFLSA